MASTFKTFLNNDIITTRTPLHEALPITGAIVSGTYSDANIKNFSHGMWQAVYDFPFLSSSANHIFDLTVGYSADSALSSSTSVQNNKKINIYNQLAQVLVGYDTDGNILEFDEDGNIVAGGTKLQEILVINLARLLYKDEVKKGSFVLKLGAAASFSSPFGSLTTITDSEGVDNFRVNSPAGEYGILSSSAGLQGLLYYQAGIAILTASVFAGDDMDAAGNSIVDLLTDESISASADAIRHRFFDMTLNNTTELNSTLHMCRVNSNDFNYSSNPTYTSGSKIVVKNNTTDAPVSYITAVGLYSADNELLAVSKLSEPLKKDPTQELIIRVRLDY